VWFLDSGWIYLILAFCAGESLQRGCQSTGCLKTCSCCAQGLCRTFSLLGSCPGWPRHTWSSAGSTVSFHFHSNYDWEWLTGRLSCCFPGDGSSRSTRHSSGLWGRTAGTAAFAHCCWCGSCTAGLYQLFGGLRSRELEMVLDELTLHLRVYPWAIWRSDDRSWRLLVSNAHFVGLGEMVLHHLLLLKILNLFPVALRVLLKTAIRCLLRIHNVLHHEVVHVDLVSGWVVLSLLGVESGLVDALDGLSPLIGHHLQPPVRITNLLHL